MIVTAYAEPPMVSLVAETQDDAFILGKLSIQMPKAISMKTKDGQAELQADIMDLVKLVTER